MTTTPAKLCALALLDSGVIGQGQTASGADANNAFTRLNMMTAQWNRQRWLIYALTDTAFVSTGAESYTVGLGGDFNIPRPDRLEDGCFIRQLNSGTGQQIDYGLDLLPSHEDYNRIILKSMGTFAWSIFYDSQFPLANVFAWPVPQAGIYELHILTKNVITAFTDVNQQIQLPDEYQAALLYNLMVRLRAAYRLPPDPVIIGLAKDSLNVIRGANAQIPTLRMPRGVMVPGRAYNVFADS